MLNGIGRKLIYLILQKKYYDLRGCPYGYPLFYTYFKTKINFNNTDNRVSTTMIIPITSKKKRDLPVHIKLSKDYDIAYKGNILMAEQLTVIDKSQILAIGDILDEIELKALDKAMTIQLDLNNSIT